MGKQMDYCGICKMAVNDIARHNQVVHPPPPPPENLVPWEDRADR